MLRAATSFDLRQHLIDNGIVGEDLPEGCVEALQEIGDSFILAAYEGHTNLLSHRSQGRAADRRYFTDRDLTSRVSRKAWICLKVATEVKGFFIRLPAPS